MHTPTRVLLVSTTASVRWRIVRGTPPLFNAKLGKYTLVNPILSTKLDSQSRANVHPKDIFLPSNDEFVFSSQDIGLAVPPDAEEQTDVYAIAAEVSSFLVWLRSLSFQDQIPSTPVVVAISDTVAESSVISAFPDVSDTSEGFCRAYLVESCATWSCAEEAARKVTARERVPVHHHILVDAFSAFQAHDYRQCLLYAAIATEALAASRLEQEYAARLVTGGVPDLRAIEIPIAGGSTVRKDPVYEVLSARTEFSSLLHERPLYLMGRSLRVECPETYRRARMLYSTRNKIVHRGELSEDDMTQCFSLTHGDAWAALCCVADIFRWFGEQSIIYPDNRLVKVQFIR
jgi:hypothetical protein